MNLETVYPKVRDIIADVLVIDAEEVDLKKRLIVDLGAESIDFLDLVFQLEQEYDIKIPRGQLEKEARGSLTDEAFEQNGVVTPEGIQALRNYFQEVPQEYFPESLKVSEIATLFTVETFCELVIRAKQKQAAGAEAA